MNLSLYIRACIHPQAGHCLAITMYRCQSKSAHAPGTDPLHIKLLLLDSHLERYCLVGACASFARDVWVIQACECGLQGCTLGHGLEGSSGVRTRALPAVDCCSQQSYMQGCSHTQLGLCMHVGFGKCAYAHAYNAGCILKLRQECIGRWCCAAYCCMPPGLQAHGMKHLKHSARLTAACVYALGVRFTS